MDASHNEIVKENSVNCIGAKGFIADKYQTKLNFTSASKEVYMLLDKNDVPSHRAVQDAREKMSDYLEIATDAMDSLSEWYLNAKEYEKGREVAEEMEEIVQDYSVTYKRAMKFQKSWKFSSSLGTCKQNITNNVKALEGPNSVEHVKQQNREISVKSALNQSRVTPNAGIFDHSRQSNIIMQLSSDSTQIGCSIESDELPPESAVDKSSYVTEENKSKSRKRPQSMDKSNLEKRSKSSKTSNSENRTKSWDIAKTKKWS